MPVLRKVDPQVLQDNLGLVYTMKKKFGYLPGGLFDWDELLSWGTEGLAFAISHYDPDKGWKFSSYACVCIKGYMMRGLRSLSKETQRCEDKGIDVSTCSLTALDEAGMEIGYEGHREMERLVDARLRMDELMERIPLHTKRVLKFTLEHPEMTHREIGEHLGISRSTVGLAWTVAVKTGRRMWNVSEEEYQKAA